MLVEVPKREAWPRLVVPFAVLAAVIAAVPVYEIVAGFGLEERELRPSREDVLRGAAAKRIEQALADRSRTAAFVRPRYNELLWAAFGVTTPKVVAGPDGWLFLADAVRDPPNNADAIVTRHAEAIAELGSWLQTHGTRLLVLPVPNKSTVHPARTGLHPPPRSTYPDLLAALSSRGVWHVDPRPALDPAHGQTYLPNDTHWSSLGARNVAILAARTLESAFAGEVPGPRIGGRIRGPVAREHRGDLQRMLGFVEGSAADRALLARVEWFEGVGNDGRPAASPAAQPTVLCGTSFSHSLGFASLLAAALDRAVTDASVPGQGPTVTLLELARGLRDGARAPPSVVVWEFPEKHLYLRHREFLDPLEDWVGKVRHETGFARKTVSRLGYSDRRVHSIEIAADDDGGLKASAITTDPYLTYDLANPLRSDGSVALSFVVRSERETLAKVYVDRGRGFVEADAAWTTVRAGAPERVTIPLEGPAPIRRIRIDPVNTAGPFEMSAPEIWTRAR